MTNPRGLRLGFLGTGWIGRHRMSALVDAGVLESGVVYDAAPDLAAEAARLLPSGRAAASVEELLAADVDGIVIASPSALHAGQALAALDAGRPVFCQKPLGRTGAEAAAVVERARARDLNLGLDLSYRECVGAGQIHDLLRAGELGRVYAVDLTFHNAYGPDKPWFYDPRQSGGGCLIDLGVHLVDMALWALDFPAVERVTSRLFREGRPLVDHRRQCEDFATARLDLATGASVQLQCSWRLPAGQDALIEAKFFGTNGGLCFRNVGGSFYDFVTERFKGTARETLSSPPERWGGRRTVRWAEALRESPRFDAAADQFVTVARTLDRIYDAHATGDGLRPAAPQRHAAGEVGAP